MIDQELEEGVVLSKLPVGAALYVRTRNAMYTIKKFGEHTYTIEGHPKYCPKPVQLYFRGQGDFVGVGGFLVFSTDEHPQAVVTSTIQNIMEVR